MPLLFLITYIVLLFLIYKKNFHNYENFTSIIKINWIIAFLLLFIYLIYINEEKSSVISIKTYVYSFYILLISYLISFIVFLLKYNKLFKDNDFTEVCWYNIWKIEIFLKNSYLIMLLTISSIFYYYSKPLLTRWDMWFEILLYLFFIFSSIYIFFEKYLFCVKKSK